MPSWAAWIVGLMLVFLVGLITGYGITNETRRAQVANECKKAGAFTVKRTGFYCGVIETVK